MLGGDPITLSVLSGVKIHSSSLDRVLMSRTQISERLTEMDAQLARLQDIADNIDKEFANTRLVRDSVHTRHKAIKHGVYLQRIICVVTAYAVSKMHS